MYLDFKVTAWERVFIPEENKDEVLRLLKDGQILTSNDAIVHFEEEALFEGVIMETEEQMVVHENSGFSTIELTDDNDNELFKNGE